MIKKAYIIILIMMIIKKIYINEENKWNERTDNVNKVIYMYLNEENNLLNVSFSILIMIFTHFLFYHIL